jgi:hypothetical protein
VVSAWPAVLKPFVVADPRGGYRTPGPPALKSRAYARDLNEVKRVGSITSKLRRPDQTEAAIWWDDPRMVEWTIVRRLATTHRLSTLQTARLFAMVNITAMDTLIACYDEKKLWSFWRPVTAVRLADGALPDAVSDGAPLVILSGGYGLLHAMEPIGDYNKKMHLADWPSGLLEGILVAEATMRNVPAVVAFAASSSDYAGLVRRAPWPGSGISAFWSRSRE